MDTLSLQKKIDQLEESLKRWPDHPNRTEIEKDIRDLKTQQKYGNDE